MTEATPTSIWPFPQPTAMEFFQTSMLHTAGGGVSVTFDPSSTSLRQYSRAMLEVNGEKRSKCLAKSYPFSGSGGGGLLAVFGGNSGLRETDDLRSFGASANPLPLPPCEILLPLPPCEILLPLPPCEILLVERLREWVCR